MMINKYEGTTASQSEEAKTTTVSGTTESSQAKATKQFAQAAEVKTTGTDSKNSELATAKPVTESNPQKATKQLTQTAEVKTTSTDNKNSELATAKPVTESNPQKATEQLTQTAEVKTTGTDNNNSESAQSVDTNKQVQLSEEKEAPVEETPAQIEKVEVIQVGDQSCVQIKNKQVPLEKLVNFYITKKKERKRNRKAVFKRRQEQMLKPYQAELIALQSHLEKTNQKMIILFEGRDAAGKGGTIRRVIRYMNEKHYRVVALGKPTEEQKTQWFYQKYIQHFPTGGEIVLFDRSWYNRAMVEQVFGFCSQKEYDDFMNGVVDFEKDLTTQGITLVKLYFSVTKAEQARRFERRKTDPLRQWKLSEIDLQAQDRWDDFTNTKYTMIKQTHSHNAPWSIIRSNNKYLARREAMKVILNSVNYANRNKELDYALDPNIVISGAREIEIMDVQMNNSGKFIN